ncbi:MAG: peptidoglycan recognition family protein [Bacteroidota bacterium]
MRQLLLFSLMVCLSACSVKRTIVQKPIIFNDERMELTKAYLKDRYQLPAETGEIVPKMIVLHWTAIPTLERSFQAFVNPTLPNWRPDIKTVSGLNVSSQFLVDQDGTIYQLMDENIMARHVIGLNHCAIGVENVGGTEETPLTRAQLKSNIWLVKYLTEKYDIEYLIGHHEYTLFENHPLWLEVDDGYRTVKSDPGASFMEKVRRACKNLDFKPLPATQ